MVMLLVFCFCCARHGNICIYKSFYAFAVYICTSEKKGNVYVENDMMSIGISCFPVVYDVMCMLILFSPYNNMTPFTMIGLHGWMHARLHPPSVMCNGIRMMLRARRLLPATPALYLSCSVTTFGSILSAFLYILVGRLTRACWALGHLLPAAQANVGLLRM